MSEGYFERVAREMQEAASEAAARAYEREVANNRIERSPETYDAFYAGWNALAHYRVAQKQRSDAGGSSRPLSFMCYMLAAMLTAVYLMAAWAQPGNLAPHAWLTMPAALGLTLLGMWTARRAARQEAEAVEKFNADWKETQDA